MNIYDRAFPQRRGDPNERRIDQSRAVEADQDIDRIEKRHARERDEDVDRAVRDGELSGAAEALCFLPVQDVDNAGKNAGDTLSGTHSRGDSFACSTSILAQLRDVKQEQRGRPDDAPDAERHHAKPDDRQRILIPPQPPFQFARFQGEGTAPSEQSNRRAV